MAKLTAPNISVTFTELGISAIQRGDKGTVAIIVRDAVLMAPFAISMASQIPDILGVENQDYIRRAFTGYINPPKKVIVYVAPERAAAPAEPHAAAGVAAQSWATELGDKLASDLVSADVAIGADGSVTGTLKYVTGWTEFNSADESEQNGYFFPLHLDEEKYGGKSITVQRNGGKAKTAKDLDWVLRVPDNDAVWTVKCGSEEIVTLRFTKAALGEGAVKNTDENLSAALAYMATQDFDYLVGPSDCTAAETGAIASWIKSMRAASCVKYKAVLPNCAADNYAIVNFVAEDLTAGDVVYTTAEYCSRIAGLLAGTPMKIAATYAPLPELTDVKRLTREEQDEAVGAGKLILVWDGRKVKLSRAVNSFVTTTEGMLDSFKKIKIVEIMDLIRTDITATAEDGYIGKYANSYDNKLLLITAIRGYFQGLERDGLVQPGYTVDIDLEAQEQYLRGKGTDISEMRERQIREADTGSWVFLLIRCKILDAIEDIRISVEI